MRAGPAVAAVCGLTAYAAGCLAISLGPDEFIPPFLSVSVREILEQARRWKWDDADEFKARASASSYGDDKNLYACGSVRVDGDGAFHVTFLPSPPNRTTWSVEHGIFIARSRFRLPSIDVEARKGPDGAVRVKGGPPGVRPIEMEPLPRPTDK